MNAKWHAARLALLHSSANLPVQQCNMAGPNLVSYSWVIILYHKGKGCCTCQVHEQNNGTFTFFYHDKVCRVKATIMVMIKCHQRRTSLVVVRTLRFFEMVIWMQRRTSVQMLVPCHYPVVASVADHDGFEPPSAPLDAAAAPHSFWRMRSARLVL